MDRFPSNFVGRLGNIMAIIDSIFRGRLQRQLSARMWMIVVFLCWVVRIEAECVLQDMTSMKVTKYSGESVLLPCSCTDLQAQGGRWIKDSVQINLTKPEDRIQMTNQDSPGNLSLLISDLTTEDAGRYRCEVHRDSYRYFRLQVTGCTLMEQDATLEIERSSGESALLPCLCSSLHAKPESVSWMTTSRNSSYTEISNTTGPYRGRIQMFNSHSPGNVSLLISDLSEEDRGIYTCVVDAYYNQSSYLLVKEQMYSTVGQNAGVQVNDRDGDGDQIDFM